MGQIRPIVLYIQLSSQEKQSIRIQLPHKPFKAVEMTIACDQELYLWGDLFDLFQYKEFSRTGGGTTPKTERPLINGDISFKVNRAGDYFLLESDPEIEFENNSTTTNNIFISMIHE